MHINVGHVMEHSFVNGPGNRCVIWVQGCNRHCKGCKNVEFWSFDEKELYTPEALYERVVNINGIEGITVSGGEPLLQLETLKPFMRSVHVSGLSIVLFTGYPWHDIPRDDQLFIEQHVDILITEPYIESLRAGTPHLRGSSNQEIFFLSDRYSNEDIDKLGDVEISIGNNGCEITGFPTDTVLTLVKGLLDQAEYGFPSEDKPTGERKNEH